MQEHNAIAYLVTETQLNQHLYLYSYASHRITDPRSGRNQRNATTNRLCDDQIFESFHINI